MSFTIRPEKPTDIKAIHRIEAEAFKNEALALLVNRLRAEGALLLSHVAVLNDEVVGHAAYSFLTITDGDRVEHCPLWDRLASTRPIKDAALARRWCARD